MACLVPLPLARPLSPCHPLCPAAPQAARASDSEWERRCTSPSQASGFTLGELFFLSDSWLIYHKGY